MGTRLNVTRPHLKTLPRDLTKRPSRSRVLSSESKPRRPWVAVNEAVVWIGLLAARGLRVLDAGYMYLRSTKMSIKSWIEPCCPCTAVWVPQDLVIRVANTKYTAGIGAQVKAQPILAQYL